jgi:hypothetical protein
MNLDGKRLIVTGTIDNPKIRIRTIDMIRGILGDVWAIVGPPLALLSMLLFCIVSVGLIAAGWKVLFP